MCEKNDTMVLLGKLLLSIRADGYGSPGCSYLFVLKRFNVSLSTTYLDDAGSPEEPTSS